MENNELSLILDELKDIRKEYNELHLELKQNQELLKMLLEKNNKETNHLYKVSIRDKSPEQQMKDFGMNVLANLAGNSIQTPTIIKL